MPVAPIADAGAAPTVDAQTPSSRPPVPVIQADRTSGEVPFTVQLTAIASTDPDGDITRFAWDFGDGSPAGDQAALSHTYGVAGQYTITLVVSDAAGHDASLQLVVTAETPPAPPPMNRPPVAAATVTPASGPAPLTAQLSAAGSSDPDNDIAEYVWTFGDGTSSQSGREVSHVYARAGQFTAQVIVTDAVRQSSTADVMITVTAPPTMSSPPVARGTVSTLSGPAPLRVTFSGAGSSDPDGDIASYAWRFGDGSPVDSRISGDHVYTQPGMFTMSLTVTDMAGNTDSISATIDVEAPTASGCPTFDSGSSGGSVSNAALQEISGMAVSRANAGVIWVHNDSGDYNRIYALDVQGNIIGAYNMLGTQAVDWEDMAIGPGPVAGQDYIYVGDIGDNGLSSNIAPVYRFPEPAVSTTQTPAIHDISNIQTIVLRYPNNGAHNVETLLVDPLTGDLYLVTKHPQGTSTVFTAAAPHSTSQAIDVTQVTTLQFPGRGGQEEATGGDISADGTQIIVRTYAIAYVWQRPAGTTIAAALGTPVCPVQIRPEPQGEAISFAADGRGFYTTSEGAGQPVWFFNRTN